MKIYKKFLILVKLSSIDNNDQYDTFRFKYRKLLVIFLKGIQQENENNTNNRNPVRDIGARDVAVSLSIKGSEIMVINMWNSRNSIENVENKRKKRL